MHQPSFLLAALLACALGATGQPVAAQTADPGPRTRPDGPDADTLGQREGYPFCRAAEYVSQARCRVGAFSNFEKLFPASRIAAPAVPSPLKRGPEPKISYSFAGQTGDLDRYLGRHPVTGLIVAKRDTILVERYQYGRRPEHLLTSFSMAKTVTALLVGIAIQERAIASLDDPADKYAPDLKGTEYGRTPIRALLQMSSGVRFREVYTDAGSDIAVLGRLTLGQDPGGSLAAIKRFDVREAAPGTRFSYASAETLVLGLVLTGATGKPVARYAEEKLWQPLGAEAAAAWSKDARGQEITFAYFHATLRDWARLGLMLANEGRWNGRSIVPAEWIKAATTVAPGEERLRIVDAGLRLGYGFQTWLVGRGEWAFAMRGYRGQWLIVEPRAGLVMVQTAARAGDDRSADNEMLALWDAVAAALR